MKKSVISDRYLSKFSNISNNFFNGATEKVIYDFLYFFITNKCTGFGLKYFLSDIQVQIVLFWNILALKVRKMSEKNQNILEFSIKYIVIPIYICVWIRSLIPDNICT